jgi:hypothetical protein
MMLAGGQEPHLAWGLRLTRLRVRFAISAALAASPVTEVIVVHCKIGEVKAVDGIDFRPSPARPHRPAASIAG